MYKKLKEKLRREAIEWQNTLSEFQLSYEELIEMQRYFERMGKKFGLLKEFKENGII
jgi:hypothetical protein